VKEGDKVKACNTNGKESNAYRILMGQPDKKRPLGRPRHGWVYNIKMGLGEIDWGEGGLD
jgi:hypothetical protein